MLLPAVRGMRFMGAPSRVRQGEPGRAVSSLTTERGPVSTLMGLTPVTSGEPGWGRRRQLPGQCSCRAPPAPCGCQGPLSAVCIPCVCVFGQKVPLSLLFPSCTPFSDTCKALCKATEREDTAPGIQELSYWVRHGPGRSA